ncbi:MAG: hypothetical protein LBG84_02925 [Treponema sp.]|jgi:hypothetical protein|nr:hypothetical protein [Treponema sp.]
MTIEELVKIIAETIAKYLYLDSQRVLALCFDEANKGELLEAARSVNGRADYVFGPEIGRVTGDYDVLFVDYIPFPHAAEAALGLAFSPWGALAGKMAAGGKRIFQLKRAPGGGEMNPECRKMLKEYWARLYSLGVRLLDAGSPVEASRGAAPAVETGSVGESAVYAKGLLSRRDLFDYPGIKQLIVGKDVLVTALAEDTARAMKIEIVRRK